MLLNAGSLIGSFAVTTVLGFLYWGLATHGFTPEVVGFASASLAAMALLGAVGILGFGTLIISELPRHPGREGRLISTVLLAIAALGMILGVAFALIAPVVIPHFSPLSANGGNVLLFALGVALTTVTIVLDQALVGVMRGTLQFWRNLSFSMVKLLVLIGAMRWFNRSLDLTIYNTWTLGNVVSLVGLGAFLVLRGNPIRRYRPQWELLRGLGRKAIEHHGLNLALKLAQLAIPLLITWMLTTTANAYFSIAYSVANFVTAVPIALTNVLYVVGAANPSLLARRMRFTLWLALIAGLVSNIVLFIAGGYILRGFGSLYQAQAVWPLRILCLAVFPLIVKDHYITICRIQNRVAGAAGRNFVGGCFELLAAAVGARMADLPGLCAAWVIAVCVEAVLMMPTVYHMAKMNENIPESNQVSVQR